MPTITTKSLGLSEDPDSAFNKANPKPVTGFDYAGQPMRHDSSYNGRPEFINQSASQQKSGVVTIRNVAGEFIKNIPPRQKWTPEKRALYAERMRVWWAKRKLKQESDAA